MKKLFLTAALMITMIIGAKAQSSFDKFYDKYAGQEGFTSVNISKDMFEMFKTMAQSKDADAKHMGKVIDELTGLKLVTLKNDSVAPAKANAFYSEASALFPAGSYKELMTVNDGGNNIRFLTKQGGPGKISEMIMLLRGKTETMVLALTGNIDLADVSEISKSMNLPGMDKLKKANPDGK